MPILANHDHNVLSIQAFNVNHIQDIRDIHGLL